MPRLEKLVRFLDDYLKTDDVDDSSWNGLQFEGKSTVKRAAFAVDAGIDAFKMSADVKADMLIVHHGHFWDFRNPSITGWAKERIKILFENDISLYVSHNPLDRHKETGHNAQILKLLGASIKDEFFHYHGKNIGWTGEFRNSFPLKKIVEKLNRELKTECRVLPFGRDRVRTIAVCSGGGSYSGFYSALDAGVDLYITGDAVEIYHTAKDAGVNVIFAGHHATETLGLHALSRTLQKKFGIETTYIDLPTGL